MERKEGSSALRVDTQGLKMTPFQPPTVLTQVLNLGHMKHYHVTFLRLHPDC